jgi:uncharacterized protein
MSARDVVDVDFRKWGGHPHYRFAADRLGDDSVGVWLAARSGAAYTGPVSGTYANDFLLVFPHDAWWAAAWSFSDEIELYVDIATPAVWPAADHVTAVDLDLDVIRFGNGDVVLEDEDEFEEHRLLYSYPDDLIERARATAVDVMSAVRDRREPFGHASDRWLRAMAVR